MLSRQLTDEQRRTALYHRMDELYKQRKADLVAEVNRNYRVIDTAGMSKAVAISYILQSEFGRDYAKLLEPGR